ncbi:MAG: DNA-binding protein WhiA [Oscillospiraceae bacterium]|nr:DNA-binding protein WhiA [Oscillospiraceae bacterium]
MSFSSQVKNELVKIEYESYCCKKSLLYGMTLFSKEFSYRGCMFQTENENIVMLYKRLLKELCNIDTDISVSPSGKNYSIVIEDKAIATKIFTFFGHDKSDTNLKVNFSNFQCPRCQNAFLAGAFLSCGTVSSPEKDYHLEFIVPFLNLTKSFITFLQEMELNPKLTNRKGYNIIYFKVSEQIEDCLYMMGASVAMFDMMNVKIVKEIRNSANRKANCETANIEKMVRAASPQIAAILKIKDKRGLSSLPEPLEQMALIRLENPDSSLQELAEMFDPPLSKSGANHRLKRLVEIAKEL